MVLLEQELLSTFPELFASLTVEITDRWSEHDIRQNHASILPGDDNAPTSIKEMIRRLARPRQYIVSSILHLRATKSRALLPGRREQRSLPIVPTSSEGYVW